MDPSYMPCTPVLAGCTCSSNAFLPAGANVRNITLQSQCAQDHSDHLSIGYDSNALQDVINALGPDNPAFQPACAAVGPLIGNV